MATIATLMTRSLIVLAMAEHLQPRHRRALAKERNRLPDLRPSEEFLHCIARAHAPRVTRFREARHLEAPAVFFEFPPDVGLEADAVVGVFLGHFILLRCSATSGAGSRK